MPVIDDHELARRVGATLRAQAGTVVLADEPFDRRRAEGTGTTDVADEALSSTSGRPGAARTRRSLVATAAVLAAVALAVGGLRSTSDGGGNDEETTTEGIALEAPPAPSGAYAPAGTPEGWRPTSVGWTDGASEESQLSDTLHGDLGQLWDLGDAAVLVESGGKIDPRFVGDPGADEPVTVRGQAGVRTSRTTGEGTALAELAWTEGGTPLRATARGIDGDPLLELLASLVPRDGGPPPGFDLPASGPQAELQEATVAQPATTTTLVGYETVDLVDPPDDQLPPIRDRLMVSAAAPSPEGDPSVAELAAVVSGDVAADGTVTAWDPALSGVVVLRPDGVLASAGHGGLLLDEQALRDVALETAMGVAPQEPSDLTQLWEDINGALAARPPIATVTLPVGEVQLRGEHGYPEAACVADDTGATCTPLLGGGPDATSIHQTISVRGSEHMLVIGRDGPPRLSAVVSNGDGSPEELRFEYATDGAWTVGVAPVPPLGPEGMIVTTSE